jgi:MarR family 2-MHQ and catechol resistance regulon transcriptional repressor
MKNKAKQIKMMNVIQRMNPDIEPEALELMDSMRRVSHSLRQIGENSLAAAGMSYARYRLLLGLFFSAEVEDREGLHPSEISERQGTSRNTISSHIRDLEDEGMIMRVLNKEDRRKFNISLTTSGQELVQEHASKHMRMVAECFSSLTSEEKEQLRYILDKVAVRLDSVKGDD